MMLRHGMNMIDMGRASTIIGVLDSVLVAWMKIESMTWKCRPYPNHHNTNNSNPL